MVPFALATGKELILYHIPLFLPLTPPCILKGRVNSGHVCKTFLCLESTFVSMTPLIPIVSLQSPAVETEAQRHKGTHQGAP